MTSRSPHRPLFRSLTYASHRAIGMALLGLFVLGLYSARIAAAGTYPPGEKKHDQPYALIFGTVWGPDDLPVYGMMIKIRRESDKKARWELHSDHNGEFAIRVPAGKQDYVIWADLKSYKSPNGRQLQVAEVKVHVENDERIDTGLHLKNAE